MAAGRLKKKVAPRTGFAEAPIFPRWASTIERLMMDLMVEAGGWLGLLKEHAIRVIRNTIDAMKAESDAKTNLLAEATQLQEQQTALMDRVQAVVEELRKKGGELFCGHACKPTISLIRWVTSGLIPSPAASWSRYFFSAGVSTSIASSEAA